MATGKEHEKIMCQKCKDEEVPCSNLNSFTLAKYVKIYIYDIYAELLKLFDVNVDVSLDSKKSNVNKFEFCKVSLNFDVIFFLV